MVIYNGFLTGLVVGILVGIVGMCIYALNVAGRDEDKEA